MDPDRWQRIEKLYHSALELQPGQRSPFLAEACRDDDALLGEVESLLRQRGSTDGLIDASAWRAAADHLDTRTVITPGTRLGPYEILGPLGAGGMGTVYRALDTRLDRHVAIKISAQQFSGRFEREARAVAALNHPNICTLHDIGPNFLVMELVEGETLAARLTKGPLPLESMLRYGKQIAEALEAAHERKIIHRDLKPGNIMLTKAGLKVLDFGLAKFTDEAKAGEEQTASHAVMGTAAYMAPEQALGKELDQRADLFSFGVVLYEMATGQRPFKGDSSIGTIDAILHQTPPPVSKLNPAIPVGLAQIIGKALEKDRDVRYQSASEMLADLDQAAHDPYFAPVRAVAVPRRVSKYAWTAALAALIVVISVAAWLLVPRWLKPASSVPAKHLLAVLPFQNLSGDVSKDYFSDGLTEELITALSRLEPDHLGVIARTSAMSYKNRQVRTDEIGRELGVDYVLEGSVRPEGDRMRVTAQLIQARDQSNLWADSYDIKNSEAMTLQRDITRRVARSLAINLLPERQSALERASTSDPLAYEAYLNGRYQWNKRTEPASRKAVEYFEDATQKDPGFAAAYAAQASSLEMLDLYGTTSLALAIDREKKLLAKALELDPELSEAYAIRALIHERGDWDHHAAESDYRRAIELNPGDATAHAWYGEFLYLSGRLDESWPQLKTAERLDPQSPAIQSNIAWWYLLSHRYEESVAHCRRQLARWPSFGITAFVLGQTFDQMKKYPDAIDAYQTAIAGLGRVPYLVSGMASSYALAGNRPAALKLLEELQSPDGKCHPSGAPSTAYASLHDHEKALACIERGIEQHSALVAWVKVSPPLEPLHRDPRFLELLRRAGFDGE